MAGSVGNQPRPWLDPQGTGGKLLSTYESPPPLNDWKGVGQLRAGLRYSLGPG